MIWVILLVQEQPWSWPWSIQSTWWPSVPGHFSPCL